MTDIYFKDLLVFWFLIVNADYHGHSKMFVDESMFVDSGASW